jgi:hypothetical protein
MNTLEFLRRILPSKGVYYIAVPREKIIDGKKITVFGHRTFDSLDFMAKCILEADKHYTVYHACSAYKSHIHKDENGKRVGRQAANTRACKSFWLDLDVGKEKAERGDGYETREEAELAVIDFCERKAFPRPTIFVNSGNGLHCYWTLTEEIPVEEWVTWAAKIRDITVKDSLRVDQSRTCDPASILRPVGTTNKKDPTNHKPVQFMHGSADITFDALKKAITRNHEGGIADVPAWLKAAAPQFSVQTQNYPTFDYDANLIAEQCAVIKKFRDTKGDLSYDEWRLAIGVVRFCKDGERLCEEWSSRRAETGHQNVDVATRVNSWNGGPTKCSTLTKCSALCQACPHLAADSTPLILGRSTPKEDKEQKVVPQPEVYYKEIHLDDFVWKDGFLTRYQPENKDNPAIRFSYSQLYLCMYVCDADGVHIAVGNVYEPTGEKRRIEIPVRCINTGKDGLTNCLGDQGVILTDHKDASKTMSSYLKHSLDRLRSEVALTKTFNAFGWHHEKTDFLIGTRLYTRNGVAEESLLSGTIANMVSSFPKPRGNVEGYAQGVNSFFNRKGMEPLQYAVLSMWSAPLVAVLDNDEYSGIPCALTGVESGKGKTTAFKAGLYAYGNALKMLGNTEESATHNARVAKIGGFCNLPFLLDEATNMSVKELSSFAYQTSGGGGRERMRMRSGVAEFANAVEWKTHIGMTGNTCLLDLLATKGNSDAEAMRLFEIRIDRYKIPKLPTAEVNGYTNDIANNAGPAGEKFIKYVVENYNEVQGRLNAFLMKIIKVPVVGTEPKCRFLRWHITCSMVAGEIMRDLGICEFDLDKLFDFAVEAATELVKRSNESSAPTMEDVLGRFMSDISDVTLVTQCETVSEAERFPLRNYVARLIRNSENKDAISNGLFTVHRTALVEWCRKNRFDIIQLENELSASGVLIKKSERDSIARGVPQISSGRKRCDVFDLSKITNYSPSEGTFLEKTNG